MCKAYNIYTNSNSPYRVDAEKNINYIYSKMKEDGKEARISTAGYNVRLAIAIQVCNAYTDGSITRGIIGLRKRYTSI